MIGIDKIAFVPKRKCKGSTDGGQHNSVGKMRKEGRKGDKVECYEMSNEGDVNNNFVLFNHFTSHTSSPTTPSSSPCNFVFPH